MIETGNGQMGCENYTPGHYFTKYLNKETQKGWSLNHENGAHQFFNGYKPRKINELTPHEMEILKQTMLIHESIFRKQVYELHRVYTVQNNMMNQLKKENQFSYKTCKGRQSNEARIRLPNTNQKNINEVDLKEPTSSSINTKSPDCVKLSLVTGAYLTYNGQKKAELEIHKLEDHIIVDLNEHVDQPSDEQPVISFSNGPVVTSQNVGLRNTSPRGLQRDFSRDISKEEGESSHFLRIDQNEKRIGLQLFENGECRKGGKLEKHHQLSSPFWYQHDKIPDLKKDPVFDSEVPERNICFPSISYSREEFPPCFSVSSWQNSAIQVPRHPSFTSSLDMKDEMSKESIPSSYTPNVNWKCHGDLFSKQNSRSETLLPFHGLHSNYKNGSGVSSISKWPPIHLDKPNNCIGDSSYPKLEDFFSVKHVKDLGLNIPSQNGSSGKFPWRNCTTISDSRGSIGSSSVGIPWIKSMQYSHETVGRHKDSAAKHDKCLVSILGRSLPVTNNTATLELEKCTSRERNSKDALGEKVNGYKNLIDLNNAAELLVETQSTTKHAFSLPYAPSIKKPVLDIDLEVPAVSETVHMVQEEKYVGSSQRRQVEVVNNISTEHPEIKIQQEETIRLTAETLLSMSYETCRRSIVTYSHPQDMKKSSDTLKWFADAVVSNSGEESIEAGKSKELTDINHDLDHRIDFYESLLSDTKVDEFSTQPKRQDHKNGKENGFTSKLQTKIRKCQGKKRRQKKEFQKDILPVLSSLSRHEVTEDLQSFGEMIKDSDLSWKSCGTRRNCGNRQGRWNQTRSRGTSVAVHMAADSLPKQSKTVLDVDGSSRILEWGRTRRYRRQRWPSGSIARTLR